MSKGITRRQWLLVERQLGRCPVCGADPKLIKSDGGDCRYSRECPRRFYVKCPECLLLFGYEPDYGGMYDETALEDLIRDWNGI